MVDGHQSLRTRNFHPSSRSQCIPFYGRQSLPMGSLSRADETISFHGRWTEDQSQLHINMLEMMAIHLALKKATKFIHHSCVMIFTANMTVVSYINKEGGTHFPNLCIEVWEILHWCLDQSLSYSRQIQHLGRPPFEAGQTYRNGMGFGSIDSEFHIPNFQLSQYGFVATWFNHKLPLYVSLVPDSHALELKAFSKNWDLLYAHAFPPFILIPAVLAKIRQSQCRIVLIAPLWTQRPWFSEVLQLLVSAPICLPLFPKLPTLFLHQTLPLLDLQAWELSNNQSEIKTYRKTLQDLSQNQEEHLLKKSMIINGS